MREKNGCIYASGTWWPRRLLDEGAIELKTVKNKRGGVSHILSVVFVDKTVPDKERAGKYKTIEVPHPAWERFIAEEEAKLDAAIKRERYIRGAMEYGEQEGF